MRINDVFKRTKIRNLKLNYSDLNIYNNLQIYFIN